MNATVYHIPGKGWFWWAGSKWDYHGPFPSRDAANYDAIEAGATRIQSEWAMPTSHTTGG